MIFNYVKWTNFRSYGDYYTKVNLNEKDVRLIVGPNGGGKTTMVDAILWGIYGKSLASVSEIINRRTKKNCEVEVNFNIGKNQYAIVRYRNHEEHGNKLFLYENQKDVSLRTILDTQNRILDIVQIPYYAMVSSIIFSSELYVSFLRSRGGERLKVFDGILNLKVVSDYYEIIKKFRKPIQDDLLQENGKKEKTENAVSILEQSIVDYKEKIKQSLIQLKRDKEGLDKEIEGIIIELKGLNLIDFLEELKKNEEYDKIKEHNDKIKEQVEEENIHVVNIDEIVEKYNEIKEQIDEIDEIDIIAELFKIDDYNDVKNKNIEIDNHILSLKAERILVDVSKNKINEINEKEKTILSKIEKIKHDMTICPTCGQEVDKSLNENIILEKQETLSNLKEEKNNLLLSIKEADKKNEKLDNSIQKIINQKTELPENSKYEESYLKGLENKASTLEGKKIALGQKITEKEKFNENITRRIDLLEDKLFDENIERSKYDTEFLNNLKETIESKQERLKEINNEKIVINEKAKSTYDKSFVEETNNKISKLSKVFEKIKITINSIQKNDLHHDILQELFSNKEIGIKRFVIEKMINLFNEKINFYLPLFFEENIVINFNKELTETIIIDGEQVSFDTFSSGEKTRLELAIAFSLFMLVKAFFSASINLLIFDEILDMNLDEAGVNSVLSIIENLSKESSIIVISHKSEYKESFKNQVNVKKVDGFSKLNEMER